MRQIAMLLLWSLAASAQTAKPEESSTIEGHILNAVTGEPVAKASLLLMRADSTQAFSQSDWMRSYGATSDSGGKFMIRNVDRGKYRLKATRNGFISLEYGARSAQRPGTVLDLGSPQQLNIDLRLTPGGVIAGHVLDADGEPVATAQVQLLRSHYVNGKKVLSTTTTAQTNDLGEYRWSGLAPGKYYIYVDSLEGLPPASAAGEEYVPVYYPGATNIASSIPLDVTAGAQVRVMDIMLHKAPTAIVKGKVLIEVPDAHGTPEVMLEPQIGHDNSAATSHRVFPAKVDASGGFEAHGLPPGPYTAAAGIVKQGRGYAGHTTVDVAAANIEGVVVVIGAPVSVTGRISVDGETTQDFRNASIKLRRGGPTVDSVLLAGSHPVAKDHTFKLAELDPDRYGFLIDGLPNGFYTKSISAGGVDITYSGVDLASGGSAQIEVLVSPKAGLVSGAALNPDTSQPAPGATVVLAPKEKERLAIFELYQQATADQYGRFTFKNVVPGEYKVYAWEDVESGAWMDPEFMKPLEDKGEAIKLEESGQANVQATIIPAEKETPK
jgi:5-hydroxyisourate hydrolase-like protein (transthyretin family)